MARQRTVPFDPEEADALIRGRVVWALVALSFGLYGLIGAELLYNLVQNGTTEGVILGEQFQAAAAAAGVLGGLLLNPGRSGTSQTIHTDGGDVQVPAPSFYEPAALEAAVSPEDADVGEPDEDAPAPAQGEVDPSQPFDWSAGDEPGPELDGPPAVSDEEHADELVPEVETDAPDEPVADGLVDGDVELPEAELSEFNLPVG